MNCPYCKRKVNGLTGLVEAQKFCRHLAVCRKNPNNIVIRDGRRVAVTPKREQTLQDALQIRHDSGQ